MGTRFIDMPIIFGKKTCRIKSFAWNSDAQVVNIVYTDEKGQEMATTAMAMEARAIRQAVLDTIIADYTRP